MKILQVGLLGASTCNCPSGHQGETDINKLPLRFIHFGSECCSITPIYHLSCCWVC